MLNKQRHIDTIKEMLSNDYTSCISSDYGNSGIDNLKLVLEVIPDVFRHINPGNFSSILIFRSDVFDLERFGNYIVIQNYSHLGSIDGGNLVIHVNTRDEIIVTTSELIITDITPSDFVYQYTAQGEKIHTRTTVCDLPKVAGTYSCFAISTFKELDEALTHYRTNVVNNAECPYIKSTLHSENRIFFKPKPEHLLRDSLVYFLKARLRGDGLEVRPEQNVDTSHPVDVKIIWGFTNHIALIEIKWLGKSLNGQTQTFTEYSESRARDGAKQLADYLDANKIRVPNHTTKGYLAVFDLRRRNTNKSTTQISAADGLHFRDINIAFDPQYHIVRNDFAQPVRMFINPKCTPNGN